MSFKADDEKRPKSALCAPPPMYNAIPINRIVKVTPKPKPAPSLFERLNTAPCHHPKSAGNVRSAWPPTRVKPVHQVTKLEKRRRDRHDADRAFLEACNQNKPNIVEKCLKDGISPTMTYADGIPALHKAAAHGFVDIVRLLISAGEKVDRGVHLPEDGVATTARNWVHGDTPLHRACSAGHLVVVQYLIEAGGHVQPRNVTGQAPMHYAARNGELKIIEILHEMGADINVSDNSRRTALHEAAACGHKPVVEWLCLKMRLRSRKQADRWGKSPMHLAAYYGHLHVVEYFTNTWGEDLFRKDNKGQTAAASTVHIPRASTPLVQDDSETDRQRPQTAPPSAAARLPRRCATPSWILEKLDTGDIKEDDLVGASTEISKQKSTSYAGHHAEIAIFLQTKVEEAKSGQEAAGLKKTLGPGVNMSNVPPTIIAHQRRLAMLQELQEAIDAETDLKACIRQVKEARAAKFSKLKDIRDAEMKLVDSHKEFVRELGEAKAAVGQKLVRSRIPQSRVNTYAKIAAECRAILNIQ